MVAIMEYDMHTNNSIDTGEIWDTALAVIEGEVTPANFKTWFRDTYIHSYEGGTVTLGVPSIFVRDYIRDKFQSLVLRVLRDISQDIRSIEYTVVQRASKKQEVRKQPTPPEGAAELPLDEYYVDASDNLNPKYQFETFVVGPFNQLAHAAAKTVTERPGITYNPLFIHGHTGHGKTHLIQAVGNKLKKSGKKVLYITSERFAVDFLNSLQKGSANSFKDKYRAYDVLIMDDVQFLSTKEKTQEELFHLFNAMHDTNKQIVFSSDIHPSLMDGMEERLRSRFNQGMIVDIPKPDFESRIAIVSAKASHRGAVLEQDVVEYLASVIEGNIRELEGALNAISIQSEIVGRPLTLPEVKQYIQETIKPNTTLTPKEIIVRIAKMYNVTPNALFEKTRRQDIVRPRQLIMYILREDFGVSYPVIGQEFGGRDHTTVIHSCEKVRKDLPKDSSIEKELTKIRALFK